MLAAVKQAHSLSLSLPLSISLSGNARWPWPQHGFNATAESIGLNLAIIAE